MPDESSGQQPAGNTPQRSPSVNQSVVSRDSQSDPDKQNETTSNLAKDVHWITHATFWSQVGLGIIGLVALWIYYGQLKEMRKSTDAATKAATAAKQSADLTRTQVVATQGALIVFAPTRLNVGLGVNFNNVPSRAAATDVQFTMTAQRMSLPSLAPLGAPSPECQFHRAFFLGNDSQICTTNFPQTAYNEMMHDRQTMKITGNLEYGNGFGDRISQPYCFYFVGYHLKVLRADHTGNDENVESFVECGALAEALSRENELRKEYTDVYQPQAPVIPLPSQP